jgi:hypothetical protein
VNLFVSRRIFHFLFLLLFLFLSPLTLYHSSPSLLSSLLKVVQLALLQSCLSLGFSCADMIATFSAIPTITSDEKGARSGARGRENGGRDGGREKVDSGAEEVACSEASVGFDSSSCVNDMRERGTGRESGREEGDKRVEVEREGQEGGSDGSEGEIVRDSQQRGCPSLVSRHSDLLSLCSCCYKVQGKGAQLTGLSRIVPYCWLLLYVLTSTVIWVLIVLCSVYNRHSDTTAPSLTKRLDIITLWSVAFAPAGAVLRYSLWYVPVFSQYVTRKIPTLKVPTLAANLSGTLFLGLCSVLAPHSLHSLAFSSGSV